MHGYTENFGFIDFWDILILVSTYFAASVIFYLLFLILFKRRIKAALAASFVMAFYLFFGAIQDFCQSHFTLLNKYSVLLPLGLILAISLIIYLKKSNGTFLKLNLFLNSLFLVYIIVDLGALIYKNFNPPLNKLSTYSFVKNNNYRPCINCPKPDIYFLLFDEYQSSASLKTQFNYDNSSLDTFLTAQGFHIQRRSTSNYNFTPFSMASILNMSYLKGINPDEISIEDYARCNELIKKNEVINFLSLQGYEIVNYSIFDLAGNPSLINQDLLPLKTKLITDATLFNRLQKDLGWMLLSGKFKLKWLSEGIVYTNLRNNVKFLDLLTQSSSALSKMPRFFYGHLLMPHPPFYFDNKGNRKRSEVVYKEWQELDTDAYLGYVTYTNTKIKELISTIKQNTKGQAVIIFMGDHGFRKATMDRDHAHYFENQNAVYFPGENYNLFYDSASTVNQFRVIFNTLFRQNFPLLKDSTIFLTDKK